jgi:hypothetical protein
MILNIYYSKEFQEKKEFEKFFIDNFLFKEKENYLAGELLDIYFFEIKEYKKNNDINIILIDEDFVSEYFESKENQVKKIVENILKTKWLINEKDVVFIALTKNFNNLDIANQVNFIRAFDKSDKEERFEFLFTEITHNLLRKILDKRRLKIFISHRKSDGREIAKSIKNYIDSELKLNNFFDETDIMDSEKWDKVLKKEIEKISPLFLYVLSDDYAKSYWTQKELITAKKSLKPMVGIDVLTNQNEIPILIANTKIFKLLQEVQMIEVNCENKYLLHTKYNLRNIINFLLKEALAFEIGKKEKVIDLPRKPDFFDICNIKEEEIIYPDPPMMNIELKEVLEICNNKEIYTPFTKTRKNLNNKKIAISISESPDLEKKGLKIEHLNLLMIEIAKYLIINGATLIYGGDLGYKKEFNFTSLLAETFRAYNEIFDNEHRKLVNYAVYPFCENIDKSIKNSYSDVIDFSNSCMGEKCKFEDIGLIAKNLTEMREKITKEMDIKIAVGGKISGFTGFYPGVLEEIYLALKAKKKVILIESFGGIVDKIIDFINGKEVEELTFEYQIKNNIRLEKFLKEKNLINEVKYHYNEMQKTLNNNKNCIKVVEFTGFIKFINNLLKEV